MEPEQQAAYTNSTPPRSHKALIISLSLIAFISISVAIAFGILYASNQNQLHSSQPQTTTPNTTKNDEEKQVINLVSAKDVKEYKANSKEAVLVYNAEIGKFKLTLPESLGIVQQLDGGGEGSKETNILIGERDEGLTYIPFNNGVNLRAIEIDESITGEGWSSGVSKADDYRELLKQYGTDLTDMTFTGDIQEAKGTLASLDAILFTVPGMFTTQYIVTEKEGILYVLSYDTENSTHETIVNIIQKNLKIQ